MQSEAGAAGALHGALQKGALATTFTASPGPAADDPQHVQDRRRADAGGDPRRRPDDRHPRPVDLRRPQRRDARPHDRLGDARRRLGPGGARLRAGRPRRDAAGAGPVPALLRRLPHLARDRQDRSCSTTTTSGRWSATTTSLAFRDRGPDARRPGRPRHRPEPRRLLPGPRGGQPVLRWPCPASSQDVMDELADADRPPLRPRRLPRRARRRAGDRRRWARPAGRSRRRSTTLDRGRARRSACSRVRLFRPFPADALARRAAADGPRRSPCSTARRSRARSASRSTSTSSPRSPRRWTATTRRSQRLPRVIGGRYGLSSKEFTPSMVKPIFDELARRRGRSATSRSASTTTSRTSACRSTATFRHPRPAGEVQAVFFGLGSRRHRRRQQGLGQDHRREHRPVRPGLLRLRLQEVGLGHGLAPALRARADPLDLPRRRRRLRRLPPVRPARARSKVLEPRRAGRDVPAQQPRTAPTRSGTTCRVEVQRADRRQGHRPLGRSTPPAVADEAGMGSRINTVMQPCFFAARRASCRRDEAIAADQGVRREDLRQARRGGRRSATSPPSTRSLERARVDVPLGDVTDDQPTRRRSPTTRPTSSQRVTARLMAGDGDLLPVSALPSTARSRPARPSTRSGRSPRRSRSGIPTICIDCGKCAIVCPHATIRMKVFPTRRARRRARRTSCTRSSARRDLPGHRLTIQVAPDDCTGCGVCVDVCPAKSKTEVEPQGDQHGAGRRAPRRRARALGLLPVDPASSTATRSPHDTVKGSQVARAAVRVLGRLRRLRRDAVHQAASRQLFGDRMIVANATGCSSIYGGNLPTTPWTVERARAAARPGATRCSRTTPSSGSGCASRSTPRPTRRAGCSSASRRSSATDLVARAARRRAGRPRPRSSLQRERVDRLRDALAADRRAGRGRCPTPARARRRPRPPERLDHRRRRLGLRHRLRRPRPRAVVAAATSTSSCSTPRSTRTPAARRRRRRRAAPWPSSPPPARATAKKDLGAIARVLRQRLRRPGRDGRQRPADDQGAARGRGLAGPVAGHRLQHLHRPRDRHGEVDDPPEGRRQERLLAAVPLPARPRSRTARRSSSTRTTPSIPIADFVATETRFAVLAAHRIPSEPPSSPTLAQADADERWRYYEQLAGIERTVPHVHRPDPDDRARGRERRRLPLRAARRRGMTVDLRTRYLGLELRSPIVASAAPLQRRAATWPGGSSGAGVGAIVLPSLFEEEILARGARAQPRRSSRAPSTSPRRSTTSRPSRSFAGAADRYLAAPRAGQGRASRSRSSPA